MPRARFAPALAVLVLAVLAGGCDSATEPFSPEAYVGTYTGTRVDVGVDGTRTETPLTVTLRLDTLEHVAALVINPDSDAPEGLFGPYNDEGMYFSYTQGGFSPRFDVLGFPVTEVRTFAATATIDERPFGGRFRRITTEGSFSPDAFRLTSTGTTLADSAATDGPTRTVQFNAERR
ncbi:MAG TPA: hypothetical protein VF576_14140 [Rubricoccaceae bacterium]|jgi:hypothetical protein